MCVHTDKLVQYLMFILEMIKGSNYFDVHCLDSLNFNFFNVDDQLLIDDWVKSFIALTRWQTRQQIKSITLA